MLQILLLIVAHFAPAADLRGLAASDPTPGFLVGRTTP